MAIQAPIFRMAMGVIVGKIIAVSAPEYEERELAFPSFALLPANLYLISGFYPELLVSGKSRQMPFQAFRIQLIHRLLSLKSSIYNIGSPKP